MYQKFSECTENFSKNLSKNVFQAYQLKAFFKCIISIFPKVTETFRNIFCANFQRYKLSVYFCFSLHAFHNILIRKSTCAQSWSSYLNIRRSTNPYKEWPLTNQNLILLIQHIIKFDLIQYCSTLLNTSHLVILIHQSPQIKLIYFMVSVKWLYFNRKKFYN